MNAFAKQLYELLDSIWRYGGTISQLAWAMNTDEKKIAFTLRDFGPIVTYRSEVRETGRVRIWFLRPKQQ